ncbi:hypothetical protein LPTSP4_18140 [Leptospira ryugenii]|uniref:Uncharacterized protein n=1 Tax=Leptospira ryugenii TaxID=1917863 RepID=A0A2P2E084_9LEPT|nr:hypothetical protein LPTSP4_18140 [Leptospira ryugenii]
MKLIFLTLLIIFLIRLVARILTIPARIQHESDNTRFYVYRGEEPKPGKNIKEKDISDKGRIVED